MTDYNQEIFDQLGGVEGVTALVDDFYQRVLADEQLSAFFARVDMPRLRRMQFEFIASALGGPVHYSGAELRAVHSGRGIENQHFARFVGHFADALQAQGADGRTVDAALAQLATYRDKVVGGPTSDG